MGEWPASEIALEPELPICDPHHHLFVEGDSMISQSVGGSYLFDELRSDVRSGHDIVRTVYVECSSGYRSDGPEHLRPVGETEWVVGQDPGAEVIGGIVAGADLRLGAAVEEVITAHEVAGEGRFRGIRYSATWAPDERMFGHNRPGLLADAGFREGLRTLGRMGHTFELWVYFHQLGEVADLAQACPETTLVLNHLGTPLVVGPYAGRRDEVLANWRDGFPEVAACENVVLKVGGIGMTTFGVEPHPDRSWSSDEMVGFWAPEVHFAIEQFGPDRCMFESNYPVDGRTVGYVELWNAFKKLSSGYSPTERAALFHDTATRIYRLG